MRNRFATLGRGISPRWRRVSVALCASILGLLPAAACKEAGDVQVLSLDITGNHVVTSGQIQQALVTKASGWLPWSSKRYFDQQAFADDLGRIRRLYQERGYSEARIADVDTELNRTRDGVRIRITIDEGAPTIVDHVHVTGADGLDATITRAVLSAAPPDGQPHDLSRLSSAEQRMFSALVNRGYPYAVVRVDEVNTAPRREDVTFAITPGRPAVFGEISYRGFTSLSESVARRELSFKAGDLYNRRLVARSEQRLASLEILRFANVDALPPAGAEVPAIPVTVTVVQNPPRRLEASIGYGSEERVRGSLEWTHLNFFGGARQATVGGKWSSVDRGVRASASQPWLFVRGLSLEVSGTSWWTYEQTYTSHQYGERVGVAYRVGSGTTGGGSGGTVGGSRIPVGLFRAEYVHEYLRYTLTPEALTAPTAFAELVSLGLDPVTGSGLGTKAAVAFDAEGNDVDSTLDPHRGFGVSGHMAIARPGLGGTFRFNEYLGEGRAYVPAGSNVVFAARARYGVIVARDDADVPFSDRYFLGGSESLRGWGRYEVAPLFNGLPIGGRATFDATIELRVPVHGPLGLVGFMDAGNVWADTAARTLGDLRRDAGVGARYRTAVGLVRADVGFQLNPVPGLIVNAAPESRHWRLHVSLGQSF